MKLYIGTPPDITSYNARTQPFGACITGGLVAFFGKMKRHIKRSRTNYFCVLVEGTQIYEYAETVKSNKMHLRIIISYYRKLAPRKYKRNFKNPPGQLGADEQQRWVNFVQWFEYRLHKHS
ncbi:MAG: hypothetical protein ACTSWN_08730 [Promethearchaeota archaeon]